MITVLNGRYKTCRQPNRAYPDEHPHETEEGNYALIKQWCCTQSPIKL